jgi:transposase
MEINAATLPDTPSELKEIVIGLQGQMSDLREAHNKETDILLEQIRHLRAQLFGRKSEKIQGGPQTLPLFDMPEPAQEDEPDEKVHVPAHDRRKRGRKPLPEELPRVEVVHDIDDADKTCACGCQLTRIGEEVSEQLDIIPAKMQVIRHIRPKYACKNCEGVEDDGPTVKIAPVPPRIIPRSIATPGLLAHILTAKFVDHTPFYRQEKQFLRLGVGISRTSMCSWAMQVASSSQPLLNLFIDEILSSFVIQADETTLQVLQEPGRDPTTKSYMWIFRRGDPERPVLIYQYHPTRGGDVAKAFLRDFEGYVQTDGYSGYDFLDHEEKIRHIGCMAHARRKFMDVVKAQGKNKKNGSAQKALNYIRKLYRIEKEAREKGLSPDERYQVRQKESKPILNQFKNWLDRAALRTPPKGLLGKAIAYTLNQWDRLVGYIEDGRLSIDNNGAENTIRPFVVGRKNWLFAGTPEGAEASALLYSLIETARANNLEPYAYLRFIFEKLPTAASLQDYEALLPWNLTPEQLEIPRAAKCC